MGKGGKKKPGKKKLDFDTFFDSTKPAEEGWYSGVSAMALDGNNHEQLPSATGVLGVQLATSQEQLAEMMVSAHQCKLLLACNLHQ
jgi:hypothetical protein